MNKITTIILAGLLLPAFCFGAFSIFESFESYEVGTDLNGQGGWVGDGFQIQNTNVIDGEKGIWNTLAFKEVVRTIDPEIEGISFYLMPMNDQSKFFLKLYNGENVISTIGTISIQKGNFVVGATEVDLGTTTIAVWNKFSVEINKGTQEIRGKMGSYDWTNWYDMGVSSIDKIGFRKEFGTQDFLDLIEVDLPVIPPPPDTTILPVGAGFMANTLAYSGRIFTDMEPIIILVIGLFAGFYIVYKAVGLVKVKR